MINPRWKKTQVRLLHHEIEEGMTLGAWKEWALSLKQNTCALYLAYRDPRVPLQAKIIIGAVVAYALSPIDLIPDFIPVLGYLDDMIMLPIGIWLAIKLIPEDVWHDSLESARKQGLDLPRNRLAALVIAIIWIFAIAALTLYIIREYQ